MTNVVHFPLILGILLLLAGSFLAGRFGALAVSSAAAGAAVAGLVFAIAGPSSGGLIAVWAALALGAIARAAVCWIALVLEDFGRDLKEVSRT